MRDLQVEAEILIDIDGKRICIFTAGVFGVGREGGHERMRSNRTELTVETKKASQSGGKPTRSASRAFYIAERLMRFAHPAGAFGVGREGGHERMRSNRTGLTVETKKASQSGRPFWFRLAHSERFERPTLRFVV